jgi:tetratricopeptide (TPR) repeat protein
MRDETGNTTLLDAEEYFHLALHASSTQDYHSCLTYLHETLKQQPRHAQATYLLAVQHAELGLTGRAIAGIREALALEPGLDAKARDIAGFQLGLLLLFDAGRVGEAREQFIRMSDNADHALRTCAEALVALADNDYARAIEMLHLALSRASGNIALSVLMQRLIERLSTKDQAVATESSDSAQRPGLSLGAYGRTS